MAVAGEGGGVLQDGPPQSAARLPWSHQVLIGVPRMPAFTEIPPLHR